MNKHCHVCTHFASCFHVPGWVIRISIKINFIYLWGTIRNESEAALAVKQLSLSWNCEAVDLLCFCSLGWEVRRRCEVTAVQSEGVTAGQSTYCTWSTHCKASAEELNHHLFIPFLKHYGAKADSKNINNLFIFLLLYPHTLQNKSLHTHQSRIIARIRSFDRKKQKSVLFSQTPAHSFNPY